MVRSYTYDAAGNATSFLDQVLTYSQSGRMSSNTVGRNPSQYIYNALGQLVEKSGSGGLAYLVYDEAGHLLGEYGSGGALAQETVWLGDLPVATLRTERQHGGHILRAYGPIGQCAQSHETLGQQPHVALGSGYLRQLYPQ